MRRLIGRARGKRFSRGGRSTSQIDISPRCLRTMFLAATLPTDSVSRGTFYQLGTQPVPSTQLPEGHGAEATTNPLGVHVICQEPLTSLQQLFWPLLKVSPLCVPMQTLPASDGHCAP
jgi:hypothetical protein